MFGVPITTLKDRVHARVGIDAIKSGASPLFSLDEEQDLVQHISHIGSLGYGYTRAQLIQLASDFAVHVGKHDRGKSLTTKWLS